MSGIVHSDGAVSSVAEQGTFNPKVEGSTPSRPTSCLYVRCLVPSMPKRSRL